MEFRDNITNKMGDKILKKVDIVFAISLLISMGLTIFAVMFNEQFSAVSNTLFAVITVNFAWLYLLVMLFFVIFILGLACTKYGNIRLGSDDSKPEYSTLSWFAMLFCAGMGVGLVFWGISEPIGHFIHLINHRRKNHGAVACGYI